MIQKANSRQPLFGAPEPTLQALALDALTAPTLSEKRQIIGTLSSRVESGAAWHHPQPALDVVEPGRPAALKLVDPRHVPRRKLSTTEGIACFLHAVAHIEFNAINLALDALYRFPGLPAAFYDDWLAVAAEEARHHHLVCGRIRTLGFDYGDFPAHNGLWDIARRTRHSLTERMALVPCVLEARGLDVTPGMIERLVQVGEPESADILSLILAEEVGHVRIGVRWFNHACAIEGVEPVSAFVAMYERHMPGRRQGPFNETDRRAAGFSSEWMAALYALNENPGAAQGNTRL